MSEPKITQELLQKAMKCETSEELLELAKSEGINMTKEQAEAFIAQSQDVVELDEESLNSVAGGSCALKCWCSSISSDCWEK